MALLAAICAATVAVSGQDRPPAGRAGAAASPAGRTWKVPRTPDGHPDLQGFWTNATYTPLERPAGITREFYSPEEMVALEKREAARLTGENVDAPATPGEWLAAGPGAEPRPGTIADVHYDFSQFGLDKSQSPIGRTLRTSLIVDPPDGRIPPLSPEGVARAARRAKEREKLGGRWDSAQSNELDDRCILFGAGPPMLPQGYNSNFHIVQSADHVLILVEMPHDARVIPIDGRPQVSKNIRQWTGVSRGRWEGDMLVVETTSFTDKTGFRGSGEQLRVTERFTRVSDDTIMYRFTLDDPSTWVKPWTAEIPMTRHIGPMFEFACHEGNYGLLNTLRGARAEDKRAAEEAAKKKRE
jgi:hypothetical protein